jgi:dihydroflavonol-4-reductase
VPELATNVPTRQIPDWVVRIAAVFSADARGVLPELGKVKNASAEKARRMLGWSPRSGAEAIVATAESLSRFGLL